MKDDAHSRHIREAKGLDPDWRVYLYQAKGGKVKLTGAIARPATKHDNREDGEPVWFKPMIGRSSMTISIEEFRALLRKEGK